MFDELWSGFKAKFVAVADRHAPLIQKKVRGVDNCPWMTGKIKKDIRQRDYLLNKARKTNRDEDWLAYKSMRNRVSNSVKKAKQTYNKKLIENHQGDTKAFWRTMKTILPGEKKTASAKSIEVNGELCGDERKIANSFNSFFVTAVGRLKQTLGFNATSNSRRPPLETNRSHPCFKFKSVNESFVLKSINQMKTGKASGLDNISPRLLKDSSEVIAKPLTRIINVSLSQGVVLRDWKFARITPLFKKGTASFMDNYQPISVLPAASKILEMAVHHQLYNFLSEHTLLSPFQCGFRKKHSTETADIAFSDFVRKGMDQGLLTGGVFIDLRKAFDSVVYALLVNKLMSHGLSNTELNWFRSYLTGRRQVVNFGRELSEPCTITSGVPQVSVNGSDLKRASEYKYLGVVMGECLTWKAHVKCLLGKVGKRIGVLGRARKNISMHSANKVYKSYIIPVLDYCDTVWNCCGTVNSDKLKRLQRRAARIIMKSDRSETALKYLRYDTLKVRRETHVLSLVEKCISKKYPHFLMDYFKFNRDVLSRITRQSDNLRLPFVKLESTKKAFFYHGCRVFKENL